MKTPLAPLVTKFFRKKLTLEKGVSRNTLACYRYAFKFLCRYAAERLGRPLSSLALEDLDVLLIQDFLGYLERECGNSPRTRNLRLTAIHSFMRFVEYEIPAALEQVRRVRAISAKRTTERLVNHLTQPEMQAVLDAPDPTTRNGVRDQTMLYLGFTAGLRVSELVGLTLEAVELEGPSPCIVVRGKGRKTRRLPLWKEACRALRAWLSIRGHALCTEVFLNRSGQPLTPAGFTYILKKHAQMAMAICPSLAKKRISPHVLRHTCAINALQATKDIRRVALLLGHESTKSTEVYLRADPEEKLKTVEAALPPDLQRGVFPVEDQLIAWLSGKKLCEETVWPEPKKKEFEEENST